MLLYPNCFRTFFRTSKIVDFFKNRYFQIDGFRGKSRYFRYFTTPKRLSLSLDPARREASGRGIWSLKKINLSNNSSEVVRSPYETAGAISAQYRTFKKSEISEKSLKLMIFGGNPILQVWSRPLQISIRW